MIVLHQENLNTFKHHWWIKWVEKVKRSIICQCVFIFGLYNVCDFRFHNPDQASVLLDRNPIFKAGKH